ncbi:MAG: hypothetical protein LBD04_07520 [Synergistaceae bacterium]|nr:hypothetical protein [Synergistaceae bacterium]
MEGENFIGGLVGNNLGDVRVRALSNSVVRGSDKSVAEGGLGDRRVDWETSRWRYNR